MASAAVQRAGAEIVLRLDREEAVALCSLLARTNTVEWRALLREDGWRGEGVARLVEAAQYVNEGRPGIYGPLATAVEGSE